MKISFLIAIIIIATLAIVAGGGVSLYQYCWLSKENVDNSQEPIACTQEEKVCPTGLVVRRTDPNCEFARCPILGVDETGWRKYENKEFGLEIKFPNDWEICVTRDRLLEIIPPIIIADWSDDEMPLKTAKGYACMYGSLSFGKSSFRSLEELKNHYFEPEEVYDCKPELFENETFKNWPSIVMRLCGMWTGKIIAFNYNNNIYEIDVSDYVYNKQLDTLNQILASVNFLK